MFEMMRPVPFGFELAAVCFLTLIPPYLVVLYRRRWRLPLGEILLCIALLAGIAGLGVQELEEHGSDFLLFRWRQFWGFAAIAGMVVSAVISYVCYYPMRRDLSRRTRAGRRSVLAIGIAAFASVAGVHILRGYNAWVSPKDAQYPRRAAASPDGRMVAVSDGYLTVRVLRLSGDNTVTTLKAMGNGPLTFLCFSADGGRLVALALDGIVTQWRTNDWMQTVVFDTGHSDITSVALGTAGRMVATGHGNGHVRLWNTATGERVSEIDVSEEDVRALEYLCDDNVLAIADAGGLVQTVDIVSAVRLSRFEVGSGMVAFSPDADFVAVAQSGEVVSIWDMAGTRVAEIQPGVQSIRSVRFSNNGGSVALATDEGTVEVHDRRASKRLTTIYTGTADIDAVVFTDGDRGLVTVSRNWRTDHWEVSSGTRLAILEGRRFAD